MKHCNDDSTPRNRGADNEANPTGHVLNEAAPDFPSDKESVSWSPTDRDREQQGSGAESEKSGSQDKSD